MHAELLSDILIILALAVLMVALFRRLHLPAVVGYLLVGIIAGPHNLNLLPPSEATRFLAELGVIFLMFYVGLEFSLPHMLAARRAVIGVGGAQVLVTAALAGAAAYALGLPGQAAILIGGALAMSSTAIALKQLAEQVELNTAHGRMVVGVLLFQDVATLPFLVALSAFAGSGDGVVTALGLALLKALAVAVVFTVAGRYLLTGTIAWVARTRSAELFMLAVLLIVLGAAFVANAVGLSLPLGAFLAGMVIGDTEFKHQVEEDVRPFRDALLGVFFASIGLQLDPTVLVRHGSVILSVVLALIVIKALIVIGSRAPRHQRGSTAASELHREHGIGASADSMERRYRPALRGVPASGRRLRRWGSWLLQARGALRLRSHRAAHCPAPRDKGRSSRGDRARSGAVSRSKDQRASGDLWRCHADPDPCCGWGASGTGAGSHF